MNDQVKTDNGYSYNGTSYQNQERTDSQGNKYTVAIPVSSLQATPLSIKTPPTQAPVNYNQMTSGVASPQLDQIQLEQQQALEKQKNDVNVYGELQKYLGTEAGFTAEQNQATGLNQANEDYIAKTAELSALNKQALSAQQQAVTEGRQLGSVKSFVSGQQAEMERNRAVQALTISAELDAIKGRADIAASKVKQAVDAKYASAKQELQNRKDMFEMNQSIYSNLSSQEQKAWDKAKYQNDLKIKEVEQKQKNDEAIQTMIIDATPNAPASVIANAKKLAESGASKLAVAQALGVYGGDYLKTQLLKAQIDTEKAQKAKYDADIDKVRSEMTTKGFPATIANIAKVEASQSVYDLANELKTLAGKGGAVGFGIKKSVVGSIPFVEGGAIAGTERANYEAKFRQLKDTLASANLDKLKGAMSDKDIEFLRNTGTALSLDMSESSFDKELEKISSTMAKIPGVQQAQPKLQTNRFMQSLGVQPGNYSGTSIISNVSDNGDINFAIPK